MEEIAKLLREAAGGTEFELRVSRRRATTLKRREPSSSATSTGLYTKSLGQVPFFELRKTYEGGAWRSGEWGEKLQIKPLYGDGVAEGLNSKLRGVLKDCIDSERGHVGHGLAGLIEGSGYIRRPDKQLLAQNKISTLGDFRDYLIVAAAVLGLERLAGIVGAWVRGEPLQYRVMALLVGVRIDRSLALDSGIGLERLPVTSIDLPQSLPGFTTGTPTAYLGAVVLSVQGEAAPALFRPETDESGGWKFPMDVQHNWVLDEPSIDMFCEALSLSFDGCIRRKELWRDFGELKEFSALSSRGGGGGPARIVEDRLPEAILTQEQFREAWEMHLHRISRRTNDGIGTAISRWVNSKRPEASLQDQFIDLRIALEALYLDGSSKTEIAFRIATYGAWHTGGSIEERCRNHKALRQAYSRSSAAVHAGRVGDTQENRELLKKVQGLCRAGIIKRLAEENAPDWTREILGG